MAYPFYQAPPFADFKHRLETEFGVRFKQETIPGDLGTIFYFERTIGGEEIQYVIEPPGDNTRVVPSLIRSICTHLKIDPAAFGLHLG